MPTSSASGMYKFLYSVHFQTMSCSLEYSTTYRRNPHNILHMAIFQWKTTCPWIYYRQQKLGLMGEKKESTQSWQSRFRGESLKNWRRVNMAQNAVYCIQGYNKISGISTLKHIIKMIDTGWKNSNNMSRIKRFCMHL